MYCTSVKVLMDSLLKIKNLLILFLLLLTYLFELENTHYGI